MDFANEISAIGEKLKSEAPPPAEEKKETPIETKVETPVATETVVAEKKETPAAEAKKDESQKELSDDELLSLIQKRGIKLPEEKKKTEDEEETEFLAWGAKEGKLKVDDYVEAKKLKDIPNGDLAKQNFAAELRAKNKNISDEEIQKKFDRKFGDETLDETDMPKIVYDEDEIAKYADNIRSQKFTPINNAKSEFSEVTKRDRFVQQVEQEFKKDIEPKITETVTVKHGNADYTINLDKENLGIVKQQVKIAFQNYKLNPAQYGNHFDPEEVVKFWTKAVRFDDVVEIIAKQRSDADVLEALKPFKNPVETDKQRDTTPPDGKPMTEAATQLGEKLRRLAG